MILRAHVLVLGLALGIVAVVQLLLPGAILLPLAAILLAALVYSALVRPLQSRFGPVAPLHGLVVLDLLVIMAVVFVSGGLDGGMSLLYVLVVVLALLLLGTRWITLYAALTCLAFLGQVLLESNGIRAFEGRAPLFVDIVGQFTLIVGLILFALTVARAGQQLSHQWQGDKARAETELAQAEEARRSMARLLAEQKKRAAQLEIVSAIAAQVSSSHDPHQLMQQVVDRIGQEFGYHVVGILLVDRARNELYITAAHGMLSGRTGLPYRQSIERGIVGTVGRIGKTYYAPDVRSDPNYFYPLTDRDPVRSELSVPLRRDGEVIGVLDLQSIETNGYDASDIAAMEILADQLAAALSRTEQLSREQKRAALLALVSEIAARTTSIADPEAMLQAMVELVQQRFGYHHVCVTLFDPVRQELELRAVAGPNAGYYEIGERWASTRGLTGLAARSRQTVLSGDIKNDPRFAPDADEGSANSELCVPLIADEALLGVLDVESIPHDGFDASDVEALSTLGNQLAAVLTRARSLQLERRRALQLSLVNRIAVRSAHLLPLKQLLPGVVDLIRDQFGYYNVALFVQEPNTRGVTLYANAGPVAALDPEPIILDGGIIGHVASTGQPYLCQDPRHDAFYHSPFPDGKLDPVQSELAVPLRHGQVLAGVLDLQSAEINAFEVSDVAALQVLADQIGEMLQNARLLDQVQARLGVQQTLAEVSRVYLETVDVGEILNAAARAAHQALNVDSALVFVPGDAGLLVARGSFGLPDELAARMALSADASSAPGRAYESRHPQRWTEHYEQPEGDAHPLAREAGFRAGLSVPMSIRDRVAGVITVNSYAPRRFSDDDSQTLGLLANQTGIALDRADYFQKQQRSTQELNLLFESYRAASATLEPAQVIARLIEQLVRTLDLTSAYFFEVDTERGELQLISQYFAESASTRERTPPQRIYPLSDFPELLDLLARGPSESHRSDPGLSPKLRESFEQGGGHSSLRVPLWSQDQLLGYVSLWESRAPRHWTADEVRFIETMASQAAAALANARLYDAATHRTRELQALYEASRLLNASLDVRKICETSADALHDLLGYHHVSIYFVQDDALELQVVRGYSRVLERIPLTRGIMARAVRTREVVVLPDVSLEPEFIRVLPNAQSEIAVPLVHGERVLGVLNVETSTGEAGLTRERLTADDSQLLSTFANQLVIAVENGRLFQETRQRLGELGRLHAATRALNSELDPAAVLARVAVEFVAALDADSFTLAQWDRSRDELHVLFDLDPQPDARVEAGTRFSLDDQVDYLQVLNEGKPRAFREDEPELSPSMKMDLERYRWRSVLALPLINRGQVVGLIELGDRRRARPFSDDEIRLAESLGSQAAIAIENARLYRDAQRRLHETETLYEFARELGATLDITELGRKALDAAAQLAPFEIGEVDLLHEPDGSMVPLVLVGLADIIVSNLVVSKGTGVIGWVVDHARTVRLEDVTIDSRYVPLSPLIRSEIAIPLRIGERVIGVLNLESEQPAAFDEHAEQLLTAFANQLAIAIENARLYEQTKRDADVKTALLRELSHRVKNNLAAITSLLYLALDELPQAREEILNETLGRVQSMALAHALLSRSERARVELLELGRQVLKDTVRQLAHPGAVVDVQLQGDMVEVGARQTTTLTLVLNELATNALRHGFDAADPPGRPTLRFSVRQEGHTICFDLEDNGPGLPAGFDLKAAEGLGLNLVRTLVEKDLQGEFDIQRLGDWTRAQVRFRLEQ